jgi:methyl-accepting chemotaxis protein
VVEMNQRLGQMAFNIRRTAVELIQQGQRLAQSAKNLKPVEPPPQPTLIVADYSKIRKVAQELNATLGHETSQFVSTEQLADLTAMDMADTNRAVSEAVAASREVSERIFVVEELSRQLRLLAMNAAVEAARSGAVGEPFIETAKEMRKLAEQSRVATGEIHRLSTSTTRVTKQAGETLIEMAPGIRKSVEQIRQQSNHKGDHKEALQQLLEEIDRLSKTQSKAQPVRPTTGPQTHSDIVTNSTKLDQKGEALMEALASFILPNDEKNSIQ